LLLRQHLHSRSINDAPKLRAATLEEQVAIDNYKEATKACLAAATSYSDKLATAGISFAPPKAP